MIGWIIALGIILLILLLILPRVYVDITAGESLCLNLRVLRIFRIHLLPPKPKKVNIRQYSAKKIRRRAQKLQKKQERAAWKAKQKALKKAEKKQDQPSAPPKKQPLTEQIQMILELLKVVLPKFAKALRIDLSYIVIRVASGDAAQTALLYGTICQSLSYLLALLNQVTNVKCKRNTVVDVQADFLSEKMTADIRITFSLSPIRVIGIAFSALIHWIQFHFKNKKLI